MTVADARGTRETASAIASAVRSCSTRSSRVAKLRLGSTIVHSVSTERVASAASSSEARSMRRSGHSITSSVRFRGPTSAQVASSSRVTSGSTSKWIARSSVGFNERAYCSARAAARS